MSRRQIDEHLRPQASETGYNSCHKYTPINHGVAADNYDMLRQCNFLDNSYLRLNHDSVLAEMG